MDPALAQRLLQDAAAQHMVTANLQAQAAASGVVLGPMRSAAFVGCVQVTTLLNCLNPRVKGFLHRFGLGGRHRRTNLEQDASTSPDLWEEEWLDVTPLVQQIAGKCWDMEEEPNQAVSKALLQVQHPELPAPAFSPRTPTTSNSLSTITNGSSRGYVPAYGPSTPAAVPKRMLVTVQHGSLIKDYIVQRSKQGAAKVQELAGDGTIAATGVGKTSVEGASGLEDFRWALPKGPHMQSSVPQYKISCVWPLALTAPAASVTGAVDSASGDGDWFTMESVLGAMDGMGGSASTAAAAAAAPVQTSQQRAAAAAGDSGFMQVDEQQLPTEVAEATEVLGAEPMLLELYLKRVDGDGVDTAVALGAMGLKTVLRVVVVEDGEVLLDQVAGLQTLDAGELCLR